MAAKNSDANDVKPASYDAEASYRVTLSRVVPLGKRFLKPSDDNVIKGKVAATIDDAIVSAEKV